MLLLAGTVVASILGLVLLIFILRLFSSSLGHVPGINGFYEYTILIIPYLIFYTTYYYLYRDIKKSNNRAAKLSASIVLLIGLMVCSVGLILSTMVFAGVKIHWLMVFKENAGYALVLQLVLLLIIAGLMAAGSTKEKDWMQRRSS